MRLKLSSKESQMFAIVNDPLVVTLAELTLSCDFLKRCLENVCSKEINSLEEKALPSP